MCSVCGCDPHDHQHAPHHGHGHDGHYHDHHHDRSEFGQSRLIEVERDILAHNDAHAARNRALFAERGILALNLVSSPGSGKTTLLCHTIDALKDRMTVAVIEGDQQTSLDADRINATGVPALQINTGKGCHLDAHMVESALARLHPAEDSVLFIENVGNLVCPAGFDLGEAAKVAILSVTEGEDKPLKYPHMFQAARALLLNKIDLLPHVDFDVEACITHALRVNPDLAVLPISARTGEGMDRWLDWIADRRRQTLANRASLLEAKLAALRAAMGTDE